MILVNIYKKKVHRDKDVKNTDSIISELANSSCEHTGIERWASV